MKSRLSIMFLLFVSCLLWTSITITGAWAQPTAKNVILLIGDGMGFNHVEAATYYQHGSAGMQVYEQFPVILAMTTFAHGGGYDPQKAWSEFQHVQKGATDSAAAATAMATGVKSYGGAIGVDPEKKSLRTVADAAVESGRALGIITSVPVSHATPAPFAARDESRSNYASIGRQMIIESRADVIMGAGHPWYDEDGQRLDKPASFNYVGGEETWDAVTTGNAGIGAGGQSAPWTLVQTRDEFKALMSGETPARVLGVAPAASTLQQRRSSKGVEGDIKAHRPFEVPLNETVPTLEEMTRGALNVLSRNDSGFFLMIEGGAIDWAGHANQSGRLIEEMIDFNRSVEAVAQWVEANSSWDETLVIVTADHETGHLTGPGSDPEYTAIVNNGTGNLPGIQWNSGGHTNSPVLLYARGAGAELFNERIRGEDPMHGSFVDNTDIAIVVFHLFGEQL